MKNLDAGVAGAGGGTLLVLLAERLGEDRPVKPWLLLLAPTVSVALGISSHWARPEFPDWGRRKRLHSRVVRERDRSKSTLEREHPSPELRARMRQSLEEIQYLEVESSLVQIRALARGEGENRKGWQWALDPLPRKLLPPLHRGQAGEAGLRRREEPEVCHLLAGVQGPAMAREWRGEEREGPERSRPGRAFLTRLGNRTWSRRRRWKEVGRRVGAAGPRSRARMALRPHGGV